MRDDKAQSVITIRHLENVLGESEIHHDLNLDVYQGEILAVAGGSGSGKTTLLRSILMLLKPVAGSIRIFDTDILHCSEVTTLQIKHRCGMAFQQGALFSSLSVLENVMFPLREFTHLSKQFQEELAIFKLILSGLSADAAFKYPADLSGGMRKRVAVARAIALDPALLFLDEPTAGLDPKGASELGELIVNLRNTLHLTVVIVTHDTDLLWQVTDRVAFLGEKTVLAVEPMKKLIHHSHPLIKDYFSVGDGRRDRRAD